MPLPRKGGKRRCFTSSKGHDMQTFKAFLIGNGSIGVTASDNASMLSANWHGGLGALVVTKLGEPSEYDAQRFNQALAVYGVPVRVSIREGISFVEVAEGNETFDVSFNSDVIIQFVPDAEAPIDEITASKGRLIVDEQVLDYYAALRKHLLESVRESRPATALVGAVAPIRPATKFN